MTVTLKIVGKQEPASQVLSNLLERAATLWPENPELRRKWLAAVNYLRHESKKGWVVDKQTAKIPEQRVLQ